MRFFEVSFSKSTIPAAPWLARWISPDSAGVIAGLNLYVYVGNNPLKYIDPTGHVKKTPEQEAQEEQEAVVIFLFFDAFF
jgi:hypothetical protein